MKTVLVVVAICIGSSIGTAGQTIATMSALSAQPQMLSMQEHPLHASQTPLAQDQDLLEHSTILYERGERPLWEVMQERPTTPLGDIARALRQEHANSPKAVFIWKN